MDPLRYVLNEVAFCIWYLFIAAIGLILLVHAVKLLASSVKLLVADVCPPRQSDNEEDRVDV